MKIRLIFFILITAHFLMAMKAQTVTSTIVADRMNFGAPYVIGPCLDSTGVNVADNTFYSSYGTWATIVYINRQNYFGYLKGNVGTAGSYDRVTTDAQGRVTSGYTPAIYDSVYIRSLNIPFVVSGRESFLCYSVKIGVTVSVAAGTASSGRVTPQHKAVGGQWKDCPYVENSPTLSGLLGLTIGLLSANTYQFNTFIPAGDSVKFTTSTTGTVGSVTFTLLPGQKRY